MENTKTITLTIDRFEEGEAVLTCGKKKIVVPKKMIPKSCNEGDIIHLTFASDEAETNKRELRAKKLLNQILRGK